MMRLQFYFYLFYLAFFVLQANETRAEEFTLASPGEKTTVEIDVSDKIRYSVSQNDNLLLERCHLQMALEDELLGHAPFLENSETGQVNETLHPDVPLKNAEVKDHYNWLRLDFRGDYSVEFRAYDEGIAYRFVTRKQGEIDVMHEDITINFAGKYKAHLQQTPSFKTSYEHPYSHLETISFGPDDKMSTLPVLIETDDEHNILISESDLYDYPAMFLRGTATNGMQSTFPRCPLEFGDDGDRSVKIEKRAPYIARTSGSRNFPWRYFLITDEDAGIIQNEMTYKLASEREMKNTEWLSPGQVSWEWWNGASPYGPDVDFKTGCNTETYKYYIDFASEFGIPYIIMDEGWAQSTTDPFTPNPEVDVFELIRYGKEKNVGIVLWLTWLTVEKHMDVFETFQDWGVAGVKIDFMDRSDQWMVNYYERVAREAAKHELFVNFHGSFKPAGLERAWPNVLSYEGVLGMEQMGRAVPDNSIYLPFMRNAVGAMDYTPGAMISMQPEVYCSQRPNSAGVGTRAYQMALFVVFESGLQMLADNPTNYYRERECTEFITDVPVTWDETKVINAEVGESLIVAKRKGDKWFIGGITNGGENERTFEVSLDFLENNGKYTLTSFEDGVNAGYQAMDYIKNTREVQSNDVLTIKMVRNGGWAAVIE
ncbi:MAG: glycoside hydrolase family 97 protein [Marinilabiliaceae bacterium]